MARNDEFGVARLVAGGAEKESVKSFVKSGPVASVEAGRAVVADGGFDVEAIGREQQRRAVAYSRSRGQL